MEDARERTRQMWASLPSVEYVQVELTLPWQRALNIVPGGWQGEPERPPEGSRERVLLQTIVNYAVANHSARVPIPLGDEHSCYGRGTFEALEQAGHIEILE